MNKANDKEHKSLSIDLNDRSTDNSISGAVEELKRTGFSKVELEIKNSPNPGLNKIQLDVDLFTKIKTIQDLPDWVIIRLILAEGKLKGSNFRKQLNIG